MNRRDHQGLPRRPSVTRVRWPPKWWRSASGCWTLIDDPGVVDIAPFKRKRVSTHWEFMFTRPVFETADLGAQGTR